MRELDLAMDIASEIMMELRFIEGNIPESTEQAALQIGGHPKTAQYIKNLANEEGSTLREQIRLVEMGAEATQMERIEQALKGLYTDNKREQPHRHSVHPKETTLRRYQIGRLRIARPPQLIITPIPPLPLLRAG